MLMRNYVWFRKHQISPSEKITDCNVMLSQVITELGTGHKLLVPGDESRMKEEGVEKLDYDPGVQQDLFLCAHWYSHPAQLQ